ncbi:hypothetical protein DITRI_Ditri08aG0032300 [Diplodiscus trichospermus]
MEQGAATLWFGQGRIVRSWQNELNWAIRGFKGKALLSVVLRLAWRAHIYFVWEERNRRIFRNAPRQPVHIVYEIKQVIRFRLMGISYDKATLICESIVRRLFPRESDPDFEGIEEAHYAFRVRDRLRKQVLVPLHKALELPELYMSSNQWNALPYNRVPSVAMKNCNTRFFWHDNQRFSGYIEDARTEDEQIAASALLPHEIIASLKAADEVAELQWRRMVEDLKRKGKLENCLAVCDVSDSMDGTTLDTCTQLLRIKDGGENVMSFEKVFDKILQIAVDEKLKEDQMIKRIFVFSGTEFDETFRQKYDHPIINISNDSNGQGVEHDSNAICEVQQKKKFQEKGYKMPKTVFWNLNKSPAIPVPSNQGGVALISGFSKNLLELFLDNGGIIDPVTVMEQAISREMYQKLSIND